MAAFGEEFLFRIVPHIYGFDYTTRMFTSTIIFALCHLLPLITNVNKRSLFKEYIILFIECNQFGFVVMAMESLFDDIRSWYICIGFYHFVINCIVLANDKKRREKAKLIKEI